MSASTIRVDPKTLKSIEKLDEQLQNVADMVELSRASLAKLKKNLDGQLTIPVNQLNLAATTTSVDKDAWSWVELDEINISIEPILQDLAEIHESTDDLQTQIERNNRSTELPDLIIPELPTIFGPCGLDEKPVTYSKAYPLAMNLPNRSSSHGPIGIFWDMESCAVPSNVGEFVALNVREALRNHLEINGAVRFFNGYGDTNCCPKHIRLACYYTGVTLIVVPNGKEAVYKTILRDMFMFARNHVRSYMVLISGNGDFAQVLHILGQLGHTVILAVPSGVGVSSYCDASSYVCDWPSMARGKFEALMPTHWGPATCVNGNLNDEEALKENGLFVTKNSD